MTITKTSTLTFRPITCQDAHLFAEMSRKKKYRLLVGTGEKENRDMANAYSENRKDYPLAHIIESHSGDVVGILVLENAGKGAMEARLITEKVPDYYSTLFKVVEICQNEKVPELYVSAIPGSPTDEYVKNLIESTCNTVKVFCVGTNESPEYKIVL